MELMRFISKAVAPLKRQVRLMVGRGIIHLVNDLAKEQEVQISLLSDEVKNEVERYQEYGFTSVPHPGAEAITVSVGGNRNHSVVVATGDRRYRLTGLETGEVALYTDEGDKIVFQRGNSLLIETQGDLTISASTAVNITAPGVTINGDLAVSGDISATGSILDASGNTNNHTHP